MKKINILIISILLFTSCEKTIHVKIEDKGRKIVVNSIFEAHSSLNVVLLESQHIQTGTSEYVPVRNASISLFENEIEIESISSDENGIYNFNQTLKEGSAYEIIVNSAKHGVVTAQSYIPKKTEIDKIEYELNEASDQYSTYLEGVDLKLNFKDKENKADFYLIQIYVTESYTYFDAELNEDVTYSNQFYLNLNSYDPSVIIADYNINGLLFNDELFDGKLHTLSFFTDYFYYGSTEGSSIKYFILLNSLSEDLYNYYLSYTKYQEVNDNPFAEPVKVYNNIENGFGIFGGASIAIDSVEIEVPGY